ncbi:Tat pathway signal sequence domain protein [Brevundimonas sp. 2R-24]|uniref:Tat pathway signal sequence domain protein n=1 Tax=Peiella sedimenti TaxID=3061083 RepID=A0ABT8SK16_9CAUL|nr:Tat pathway signal sequence domain protein [Caulobacteraceae bacterium XZ-24]
MRRVLMLAAAALIAGTSVSVPADAYAQSRRDRERQEQQRRQEEQREQQARQRRQEETRRSRLARLRRERPNQGPCPYVKILYDAARYLEFQGQPAASTVGWTGEIEGVTSDCVYRENNDPIRVDMNVLFHLGRGPTAQGEAHTYRFWVAVTERNTAILTKEYFDLPVTFDPGQDRVAIQQRINEIVIPRANENIRGDQFEILVGFDVTPAMADFNRQGARFRINAGQTQSSGG